MLNPREPLSDRRLHVCGTNAASHCAQIEDVYELSLPGDVRRILVLFEWTISFGLTEVTTLLTCVGLTGFAASLRFWMAMPAVLVLFVCAIYTAAILIHRLRSSREDGIRERNSGTSLGSGRLTGLQEGRQFSPAERYPLLKRVFQITLPLVLRLLFFIYPVVTNVAFDAFHCYSFQDGDGWLAADVSVVCHREGVETDEYRAIQGMAWVVVALYPCGLIAINGAFLLAAREAIHSGHHTPLSRATRFLYSDYSPLCFWWELAEMMRRLVLVGIMNVVQRGSVTQLLVACVFCAIYFAIQMQLQPYNNVSGNFLANACNFAMIVFVRAIPTQRTLLTRRLCS
jgi:hypothetical protein